MYVEVKGPLCTSLLSRTTFVLGIRGISVHLNCPLLTFLYLIDYTDNKGTNDSTNK